MPSIKAILSTIIAILIFLSIVPPLSKSIIKHYAEAAKPKSKVGRVYIKGGIMESQQHQKHLEKFFKDDEVKAVLLEIDSPGGTVGHSQALFMEINALKKKYNKPVISVVENICASGAYYIACSSDCIIAPPGAIIGSIGCYIGQFKCKELLEFMKVRQRLHKSGKYKTILNPYGDDETEEQDELIQHISDEVYEQFVRDVARSRGLKTTKREEWADGKIFTAKDALKLGLINKVGYMSTAQDKLKALIKSDKDIEWVKPPKPNMLKKMMGMEDVESQSFVHSFLGEVWSFFELKSSGIDSRL